jgi:hypothetical protein
MTKAILGSIAGLAVWLLIATLAGVILRAMWPAYASVADEMTFTLPMMLTRLAVGALATIVMGIVTATIPPRSSLLARLLPGVLLLLVFIPQHVMLWEKFPIWYHLAFLSSLVPLTYLGGRIGGFGRQAAPVTG